MGLTGTVVSVILHHLATMPAAPAGVVVQADKTESYVVQPTGAFRVGATFGFHRHSNNLTCTLFTLSCANSFT